MTRREFKELEAFANRGALPDAPQLSEEAARQGVRTVEQLEESVALTETCMKAMKELYEGQPLMQAILGAMSEDLTDFRSHLPRLLHEAEEAK